MPQLRVARVANTGADPSLFSFVIGHLSSVIFHFWLVIVTEEAMMRAKWRSS